MEAVELKQTRELAVGDTLVSATGSVYEITKLTRIGRGIRSPRRFLATALRGYP